MKKSIIMNIVAIGSMMSLASTAAALNFTFQTASGATEAGGNPVSARANMTTGDGTLSITITNLIINPNTVAQNVSDLFFALDGGASTGTLDSSVGNLVNIAGDGTATPVGSDSTGWAFSYDASTGFHLDGLGLAAHVPAYTIVGAPGAGGIYSNANGSIAGNGPHNPFLDQSATFNLSIAGITADTRISDVIFSFGTTPGNNVGVPDGGLTIMMLGAGLVGIAVLRRKIEVRRANA